MSMHKTMKAGDILYVGSVKIRANGRTSLSVDADRQEVIIHATEHKPGGSENELKSNLKE